MRGRRSFVFALGALCALAAAPCEAQVFVFHLSGDQEVPPTPSTARGGCRVELDAAAGEAEFACAHDVVGATLMHVHVGAAGVNGAAVFDLGDPTSPVTATWTGMSEQEVDDLLAGELYVNVHTAGRPAGEIRGQILPRTFDSLAFPMDGAQQVPPNASPHTGSCLADLDEPATAVLVECSHDVVIPTVAHVHSAPRGENGPSLFTFTSPADPSGTAALTPVEVAELVAGLLYVDVHSADSPDGEIRGQIAPPLVAPTTGAIQIVKRTFPGGGTGFGFTDDVPGSAGSFTLDDGESEVFLDVAPGTYTFTEDDPAGANWALGRVECSDGDSTGNRFARSATVALAAGELVTCTFENVALASGDPFVFHLSGDQEVPPQPNVASGGCRGDFDDAADELTLVCVHDIVDATTVHIHGAAAGANGPVVFDLGSPTSPVLATWSGMTSADVAALLAGNLYVNVHSGGRPEGQIRGQILPRTWDFLAFEMNGGQQVPPDTSTATGSCTADLDDPAEAVAIECTHDVASPTDAHVHSAPFGQNGPVVFVFPSGASPLSADVPLSPIGVAELVAGFLYVNVHSVDSPVGEIRGQIAEPPVVPTAGTIRIVKRTFPGGGTGFGFTDDVPGSAGSFTLDDGGVEEFAGVPAGTYTIAEDDPSGTGHTLVDVDCSDENSAGDRFARTATVALEAGEIVTCTFSNQQLAGGVPFVFHLSGDQEAPPLPNTASGGCMGSFDALAAELTLVCTHDVVGATVMHVHRGAPGVNGPVAFDLGDPASPVLATWSGMTPADVADLLAGNLYVNIHTSGRPAGAIRGQIVPRSRDGFDFPLEGDQQVPPVDTAAGGRCFADLSDAADQLVVRCEHTVAGATAAHVHQAPFGQNGPVRFHLGSPASPFTLSTPMTPRDVADLMAGFFYVNVHSEANPDGEVRGQIVSAPASITEVPTLGEWGMGLLALALALAGMAKLAARP